MGVNNNLRLTCCSQLFLDKRDNGSAGYGITIPGNLAGGRDLDALRGITALFSAGNGWQFKGGLWQKILRQNIE